MGMAGATTSSSSSDELTTCRNRLVPFGGLRLAPGDRASGGSDPAGAFLKLCLCISSLSEFSIKDSVESSKSSPDL